MENDHIVEALTGDSGWRDMLPQAESSDFPTQRIPSALECSIIDAQAKEIEKLRAQLRHLCRNCDLDRLEELAEADKDGRVVVLPCKDWLEVVFGDQVLFWGIDKDYEEQPIREISLDDAERVGWYDGYKTVFLKGTDENGEAWEFYPEEIGKTVFLTREEAEAALEAMKDE